MTAIGLNGATWLAGPMALRDLIGIAVSAPLVVHVIHLWIRYAKQQ